ncbi:MAG: hypothetical protein C0455_10235 [Ralstonia sp.]|nr:hypothetical protein [Ralstonia sp.]MBA4236256.1 hypothetical protein [Ralstonia sp.]MBA4277842.1 hypothetical protein [Ralstonia sp.]MBA4403202.1 hypothetical protein [Ralstonia sp.]POH85921.1 hypothetical protein CJ026_002730 [Ralstonia pickettii]
MNSVFDVGVLLPFRNCASSYRKTNSGCFQARNLLERCFQSITIDVQVEGDDLMIDSVSCG